MIGHQLAGMTPAGSTGWRTSCSCGWKRTARGLRLLVSLRLQHLRRAEALARSCEGCNADAGEECRPGCLGLV